MWLNIQNANLKIDLAIVWIFVCFQANCQDDFLKYYSAIDSAVHHANQKDFSRAIAFYEVAFKVNRIADEKNLKKAIFASKKANHDSLQVVFQRNLQFLNDQYDEGYKNFIDSLFKIDQSVRKPRKYNNARIYLSTQQVEEKPMIDSLKLAQSKILMAEWVKTDSVVSSIILAKIAEKGYPSIAKVGEKSHWKAFEILVHFGLEDVDITLQPILDTALEECSLKPSVYAYITDAQRTKLSREQLYCQYQPHNFQGLPTADQEFVLENRKRIGLSLEGY